MANGRAKSKYLPGFGVLVDAGSGNEKYLPGSGVVAQVEASTGITFVGEASAVVATGAGTQNVTLPVSLEDDIVVIALVCDEFLSPASPTYGLIGQSYVSLHEAALDDPGQQYMYKRMGATPDTTVTITQEATADIAVIVQVWRGVDTTTAIDATATVSTAATGNPDPPSYTTVTNNALVIAIGGQDDDAVEASMTAPSGYTNLLPKEAQTAGAFQSTAVMASKLLATAGAEDPGTFTNSGDDRVRSITFALRPAGASLPLDRQRLSAMYFQRVYSPIAMVV